MESKLPIPGDLSTLRRKAARGGWSGAASGPKLPPVNGNVPKALAGMQLTLVPDAPPKPKRESKAGALTNLQKRVNEITDEAIEAYNRILARPHGHLPAVTKVSLDARRDQVKRSLTVAMRICEEHFGDTRVTAQFWQDYFTEVSYDDFKSGRDTGRNQSHGSWKPDFEYLTRPATMIKVFEEAAT